ncbi:hypothetical protein AB0N61_03425 [Microbacterium sp. NPDC089320]|uniref:hypothetical protein n=1 Tax=Microbacterium sp. NPDC089320 TaxID=3155182 RepID=UPI00344409F0
MVDIVYLCSNNSTTSVTAAEIQRTSAATGDSERKFQPRVKRGWNRLSAEQQASIIVQYSGATTSTALAEEFGVAQSTILRIHCEPCLVVRPQPMTSEQVSKAADLYESGLSLS